MMSPVTSGGLPSLYFFFSCPCPVLLHYEGKKKVSSTTQYGPKRSRLRQWTTCYQENKMRRAWGGPKRETMTVAHKRPVADSCTEVHVLIFHPFPSGCFIFGRCTTKVRFASCFMNSCERDGKLQGVGNTKDAPSGVCVCCVCCCWAVSLRAWLSASVKLFGASEREALFYGVTCPHLVLVLTPLLLLLPRVALPGWNMALCQEKHKEQTSQKRETATGSSRDALDMC